MTGQQAGTNVTGIRGGAVTLAEAADAFLSSPRAASLNTRRVYAGVLDRLTAELGPGRPLADVPGDEIAAALRRLWGESAPTTWNRNRAAVVSWLTWCAAKKRWPAAAATRRRAAQGEQRRHRALPRARVERLLSRRDVPLREKTLWRMLYETAARASEILALNVEDLDLEQRRAPVRSKGGDTEFVYWDTGTAHLLPRLLRLPDGTPRASGPLFLASRRPVPALGPHPVTPARTPAGAAWATTAPGSCSRSTPAAWTGPCSVGWPRTGRSPRPCRDWDGSRAARPACR